MINQELQIVSDLSQITEVEHFIIRFSEENGIPEGVYGNMLIAISEAVTNGILHGNQNDIIKHVKLVFSYTNTKIICTITDMGTGFDLRLTQFEPDPSELLIKPHGRGIFLMRQLSDHIEFKNSGSTVLMEFNI
jgi:serine/threonine-protein kinase RsbW